MSALFTAESFTKAFGSLEVLKSASIWAHEGKITVLMGGNGSGKTTLLRAALGLCKSDQGHVVFDGVHHSRPRLHDMAGRGLYFLPDCGALSRRIRCAAQAEAFTARFGLSRFETVARELGVLGLLNRYPGELAGGERMRVELAIALARGARCLIADEPLVGVEPRDRPSVLALLRSVADAGAAVVLTGHDVVELLEAADDVIWMVGGTTHGLGSSAEARTHSQFVREHLGPAFMK